MSLSIWEIGHLLAMRSSVCASQASGSTSFIFAVCRRVAMVAHVLPPPSIPAKSAFFRVIVWGLMARSKMLESISIRPSRRKRPSDRKVPRLLRQRPRVGNQFEDDLNPPDLGSLAKVRDWLVFNLVRRSVP